MNDELKVLAERVQALTGPCRETDADIVTAIAGYSWWTVTDDEGFARSRTDSELPAFTASLDAAMTLVPEGCSWVLPFCNPWQARIVRGCEVMLPLPRHGAAAPALALTAAALLARAT